MKRTALYFATVAAHLNDVLLGGHLVAEESDPTKTLVLRYDGRDWKLLDRVDGVINDLSTDPVRSTLGILGREGYFAEVSISSGVKLSSVQILSKDYTYLEALKSIGGRWFACGGSRQVFSHRSDVWVDIDSGIFARFKDVPEDFLLSIDGFVDDDIYVCGSQGFVGNWNGNSWHVLDTPTNVELNRVLCSAQGQVMFCGGGGALFAYDPAGAWTNFSDLTVFDGTFWDMVEHGGKLFLAGGDRLLTFDGRALAPVTITGEDIDIYRLASGNSLWAVGGEIVYEFDGSKWKRHASPAN